MLSILASTHSISQIDGHYHGHPVDVEIFKTIGWVSPAPLNQPLTLPLLYPLPSLFLICISE
jgi:hypothetical protein